MFHAVNCFPPCFLFIGIKSGLNKQEQTMTANILKGPENIQACF